MKLTVKIFLVCLSLVFINASSAFAYKFTGTKWSGSSMPVNWKMNSAGSADVGFAASKTAVQNAFDTWEATASTITFSYAGTSSATWGQSDGTNVMVWYESNWTGSTGRPSGTIAVCRYWYSGGRTTDADIAFNGENYTWSASGEAGKMDIQDIATHETGHFLGLGDLYGSGDTAKTMYGYSGSGETSKRSLHSDDIAGVNALYPPGYPIMTYDPAGSFSWNNTSSSAPWTDIAAGDFDGDGNNEIVVIRNTKASWGSKGYPVLIVDPGSEMTWDNTSSSAPWSRIAAGDFDGDGNDEIAVIRNTKASWGSKGYPILIVDPGGEMTWSNTSSGTPWTDIAAGDFDGDGNDEIAVIRNTKASWGNKGYPILIVDPGGEMTWSNTSSGTPWADIAAGDFDGDGNDEIAAIRNTKASWGNKGYPVLIVDPGGEMTWSNTSSGTPWADIAAGDFDGDGNAEIAVIRNTKASWGSKGYPVLIVDPGGEMTWSNTSSGTPLSRIAVSDLDGDVNNDAEIAVIRNYRATW